MCDHSITMPPPVFFPGLLVMRRGCWNLPKALKAADLKSHITKRHRHSNACKGSINKKVQLQYFNSKADDLRSNLCRQAKFSNIYDDEGMDLSLWTCWRKYLNEPALVCAEDVTEGLSAKIWRQSRMLGRVDDLQVVGLSGHAVDLESVAHSARLRLVLGDFVPEQETID